MIKNTIYMLLLAMPAFAFMGIMSNGAPASSTGAPGEVNCTTSGCHTDFTLNSGPGNVSLTIANGATKYIPGATYSITANITQGSLARFGFQLIALAGDNSVVGTLNLTDAARTQLINGYGTFSGRKYLTYTYPGTAAVSPGLGEWSFEWTAPSSDKGPVTFYLATIAANNDGTDAGDYCYTKSLTLASSAAGLKENSLEPMVKTFPNPVSDEITVSYVLEKKAFVKIQLHDISGRVLEEWISEDQQQGAYDKTFKLGKNYPKGIYFLSFTMDGANSLKKVIID